MIRLIIFGLTTTVFAQTLNDVADSIVAGLGKVNELLAGLSFVAGLCFLMATFFKLKQHKDNPTQVPIGNPLMFLVLAVLLLFVGNLLFPVGEILFGGGTISGQGIEVLV